MTQDEARELVRKMMQMLEDQQLRHYEQLAEILNRWKAGAGRADHEGGVLLGWCLTASFLAGVLAVYLMWGK